MDIATSKDSAAADGLLSSVFVSGYVEGWFASLAFWPSGHLGTGNLADNWWLSGVKWKVAPRELGETSLGSILIQLRCWGPDSVVLEYVFGVRNCLSFSQWRYSVNECWYCQAVSSVLGKICIIITSQQLFVPQLSVTRW